MFGKCDEFIIDMLEDEARDSGEEDVCGEM